MTPPLPPLAGLYKCFDAAYPPASPVPGCAAAAGYIGAEGKTPHVWTVREWEVFSKLTLFPIWVPDLTVPPVKEAMDILHFMHLAGFPVDVNGVIQAVIIDYETTGAPAIGFHGQLADQLGKYRTEAVAYGSLTSVVQIEAAHVWSAEWNDVPSLNQWSQTVHAHQYEANVPWANTRVDYSIVDGYLMQRGYRHG